MKLTQQEQRYISSLQDSEMIEAAESEARKLKESIVEVLSTPEGRDLVWYIFDSCDMFSTTFTGNSWQAFKEGRRAVGLELLEQINVTCPQEWIKMQAEKLNGTSFEPYKLNK